MLVSGSVLFDVFCGEIHLTNWDGLKPKIAKKVECSLPIGWVLAGFLNHQQHGYGLKVVPLC